MISPEILRKHPFFGFLKDADYDKIAVIAEEVSWEKDDKIFEIGSSAVSLFLLQKGGVELHYSVVDEIDNDLRKDFYVGDINPDELFGLSGLIEPFKFTGTIKKVTIDLAN